MTGHQRKAELFRGGNRLAAEIIAADPVKYPPDSLPAVWVAMVLNPPAERTEPAIGEAA